jgi:Raf kinase inhibitor-like YbhB/YbcL family protein
MLTKRQLGMLVLAAAAITISWFAGRAARGAEPFVLTSPAFKDGAPIPGPKYAGNLKSNPNCVGENVSPPFAWSNPPAGTKSFALIMFDPEGRGGAGVIQWVAYGIPVAMTGLAEGDGSQPSDKFATGKSAVAVPAYLGPCAPPGAPHHYVFTLIANDLEPGALQPGLTRDELIAALGGHVKGVAGIVGLYARP